MAHHADRKRRIRQHVIADLSVNHVERQILRCGWIARRAEPDYGVDLRMQTCDPRGQIESGEVIFQVKATDSLRVMSRQPAVAVRLDWRDVVYWLNERMPVILVMYDAQRDRASWLYLQESLRVESRKPRLLLERTLTIHVPIANVLKTRLAHSP